jgi:hypothetical protein
VQRREPADERKTEEPPAAEIDDPDHERKEDRGDHDA